MDGRRGESGTSKRSHWLASFLWVALTLLLASCRLPQTSADTRSIKVQLNWQHYATFAGFYQAAEDGLYQEVGLAPQFLEAGPQSDYLDPVIQGEAEFGVASADALMTAQASGAPLVAVAAILQNNPAVFVARADSGIHQPQDLAGRAIRVSNQLSPMVEAFLEANGISYEEVELVNLPSNLEAFQDETVPVWTVYRNSFAIRLLDEGYELNFIYPDDYRIHFLGEVIFVHEELLDQNPEMVRNFVTASLAGYRMAIQTQEAVGALVQQYASNADPAVELEKWRHTIPLMLPSNGPLGWIDPEQWSLMEAELRQHKGLPPKTEETTGFTNEFIGPYEAAIEGLDESS